jgi:hypothetical protein
LLTQGWLIGAAIVAIAGVYQFGSVKHRCLDESRSPFMFITGHWHGLSARRGSFLLCVNHGAFCIGCCWALMLLVTFAVRHGKRRLDAGAGRDHGGREVRSWAKAIGRPLCAVLIAWSAWIVVQNVHIG